MSTDNAIVENRLKFFQIDGETSKLVQEFWTFAKDKVDPILGDFYTHVLSFPRTKEILGSKSIDGLKNAQKAHWGTMFSGHFDDAYFAECEKIGSAHDRIGLDPMWYIGGYSMVLTGLSAIITTYCGKDTKKAQTMFKAVNSTILMDMEIAISVYIKKGEAGKLKDEMLQLANTLDQEIQGSVAKVIGETTNLKEIAENMTGSAAKVSESANVVMHAAESTTQNVQTVAAATEELASSSQEIGSQMNQAATVAKEAVVDAENAQKTIQGLSNAAEKISEVVDLINTIARQTNLLALNATIEAARAGEAGKGFAVVANEVKNLASQTASATNDVAEQASSIQAATRDAVSAIERINTTIVEINNISTTIAAAVEEQSAATSEISRNAQEAASNTIEVSSNIEGVSSESAETGRLASQIEGLSGNLTQEMHDLKDRLTSLLRSSGAGDRRKAPRKPMNESGTVNIKGTSYPCTVVDVSEGGCAVKFEGADASHTGSAVTVSFQGLSITGEVKSIDGNNILHIAFRATREVAESLKRFAA